MSNPAPYSERAIRGEISRTIRLYPREQLAEAIVRYIGENFVPKLSPKKRDHLLVDKDLIIGLVCGHFKVTVAQIGKKSRRKSIIYPRQILCYFLSTRSYLSLAEIGRLVKQHHTTIRNSRTKIIKAYNRNITIRADVDYLTGLLPKEDISNQPPQPEA